MFSMHNNLMKRYQKELKTNTAHVEQIATLSVSINFSLSEKKNLKLTVHINHSWKTEIWKRNSKMPKEK